MELTPIELFRAKNGDGVSNVKECEGEIIKPVAFTTKTYTGQDDKEHNVLIIKDGNSGRMYKTEVKAFIEKFLDYDASFGGCDDSEKPDITIVLKESKKGNKYVTFDLVG